ncbi:MAG TPA: ABC transporter permease [Gammaproteobacteria bacterium]
MRRELPSGLGYARADDAFFATLGLPIVGGRNFASSDSAGAPRVAIVSESLGRFIAGSGSPTGRSFPGPWLGPTPPADLLIVGVVPDLITEVDDTEPLMVYQPLTQLPPRTGSSIFLRAARDPDDAIRQLTTTAKALEPRLSLQNVMTLDEQIGARGVAARSDAVASGGMTAVTPRAPRRGCARRSDPCRRNGVSQGRRREARERPCSDG